MSELPLEGIRIIDFSWVAAGPVMTSLLCDMGAEVIKIESRKRLDYCRLMPRPPRIEGDPLNDFFYSGEAYDTIPLFHEYNRGKKSITIDIKNPKGIELLKKIISTSDVVCDNFTPRVMKSIGLDYESLRAVKPDIVVISASAGGAYGPLKDLKAFAANITGLAGLEGLYGYHNEDVLGSLTFAIGDYNSAFHGAFAILGALYYRKKSGKGQFIDMCQIETTAGLISEAFMDFFMNKRVMGPPGNYCPTMSPHGIYSCRGDDQWVSIAVKNEEWPDLVEAMGRPVWALDKKFSDQQGRLKHRDELDTNMTVWTKQHTKEEVTRLLQQKGIAAMGLQSIDEFQNTDPHFRSRKVRVTCGHPGLRGNLQVQNNPVKLSETPAQIKRLAPLLGEHTYDVLINLAGLTRPEVDLLVEEKVLF